MTRRAKAEQPSGYTVLLVDDNPDYLQATRLLLEREGHNVLTATNGAEALGILPQQTIDLLLLDYFMPGMTGEQVVAELRKFDPLVQVILQTGYASEQPPRELLQRLNIQGYYDKTEGPEQLLLWTAVGLKAAQTVQLLSRSRSGIASILEASAELCRPQSPDDIAHRIVEHATKLLATMGTGGSQSGFLVERDAAGELVLRAGTGAFTNRGQARDVLDSRRLEAIDVALRGGRVEVGEFGTIVPLYSGMLTLGAIGLEQPVAGESTLELLRLLAAQAGIALQNAQLSDLAMLDVLTGAYAKSAFERALVQELRASLRGKHAVALLLVDVDDMKSINEKAGHLAGDDALKDLGAVVRQVTRAGDIVGRCDGDAFGIVLRDPMVVGPARVAARLQELLRERTIAGPTGEVPLRVSIGFSLIEPMPFGADAVASPVPGSYFVSVADKLKASALAALEECRREGGATVRGTPPVAWPPHG